MGVGRGQHGERRAGEEDRGPPEGDKEADGDTTGAAGCARQEDAPAPATEDAATGPRGVKADIHQARGEPWEHGTPDAIAGASDGPVRPLEEVPGRS